VGVPRLSPDREKLPPFTMDEEYAEFAASALRKAHVPAADISVHNLQS
jgi:hypothetical protein